MMLRSVPRSLVFAAGVLAGLAIASLLGVIGSRPRAFAQPPAAPTGVRYVISSWAADRNYGAYVIDTQTGEVSAIDQHQKPQSLGRVSGPER